MRILGIDPGLRTTGFGVIEADGREAALRGQRHHQDRPRRSVTCRAAEDHLRGRARGDGALPARLRLGGDRVRQRQPAVDAAARPWARGAALAALVSRDLAVAEYTALQMKKAVVGHGQARKEQVQAMVARLLALPGEPGRTPPTRSAWRSATPTPAPRSRRFREARHCRAGPHAQYRKGAPTDGLAPSGDNRASYVCPVRRRRQVPAGRVMTEAESSMQIELESASA